KGTSVDARGDGGMKANEFVKEYGIDIARECLEERPKNWETCHLKLSNFELVKYIPSPLDFIDVDDLKRLVESHELVEKQGGLERVKKVIDGKHIGYTHFYLHSNGRYVFLDHYVDFIPDHAQHIGMFNKVIADVESCQ